MLRNDMMKRLLILFVTILAGCAMLSCGKEKQEPDQPDGYTVTFETGGGQPVPEPQVVKKGGFVEEPAAAPEKEGMTFCGWYSSTGLKYNFKSSPVYKDMTLYAKYWEGPKKYIFINDYDWSYLESSINGTFGSSVGNDVAVGQAVLFYIFERPLEKHLSTLGKHLAEAEEQEVPVLIQLDPITFWDGVPELWNWFDEGVSGYDDSNRENVEWTSWSSSDAVKIGWLNWGSQIRLKPMANLFSPKYQAAVRERMSAMLGTVSGWYKSLPDNKKWLLGGVKITGELCLGLNNWYYTGGNDLYGQPQENDPVTGTDMRNKPSRSAVSAGQPGAISTIGYAGVKSAGIKTEGTLTADDILELERRFTSFVSDIAMECGFSRDMVFAHAGGVEDDLSACINDKVSPSWSLYNDEAKDPQANSPDCMNLLKKSDAPAWGAAEWAVSGSASDWSRYLRNTLAVDRCRFISIYTNVIGNNNGTSINDEAVEGIKAVQKDKY